MNGSQVQLPTLRRSLARSLCGAGACVILHCAYEYCPTALVMVRGVRPLLKMMTLELASVWHLYYTDLLFWLTFVVLYLLPHSACITSLILA